MNDLVITMNNTDFVMLQTKADRKDGHPWHQLTQWFEDHSVKFNSSPTPIRNEAAGRWEDAWILTFPSRDARLLFKLTWEGQ